MVHIYYLVLISEIHVCDYIRLQINTPGPRQTLKLVTAAVGPIMPCIPSFVCVLYSRVFVRYWSTKQV